MLPLAVHISDGVLPLAWQVGGFALAVPLVVVGLWRLADSEIPRIALFTAAFFVASLIHLRVGPTSVHLLVNGVVGVVLGWRSGLAIGVGLLLQAVLIGHGGFTALGVNTCVMTIPALGASGLFWVLRRLPVLRRPMGRALLVTGIVALWGLSLSTGVELMLSQHQGDFREWLALPWHWWSLHPAALVNFCMVGLVVAFLEKRLKNAPDFPLGLLIGEVAVLLSVGLNGLVLALALPPGAETVAAVVFVAHLPLAALEGVVCGFAVSFLMRVAPQFVVGGRMSRPVERE